MDGSINRKVSPVVARAKVCAMVVVSYLHKKTSGCSRGQTHRADTSVVPLELTCLRGMYKGRQATGSVFRVKDWLDGPGAILPCGRGFQTRQPGLQLSDLNPPGICRFTAAPALPGRMKREPKDGKRLLFASNKVVRGCAQDRDPTRKGDVAR
jgi:hypothetical protein